MLRPLPHTDIRWPNVIKCSNDAFCLIDLETVVKLGYKTKSMARIVTLGQTTP